MAVYNYLFDDFNDNVIDTTKWIASSPGSGLQSETLGELRTPAAASAAPTIMLQDGHFYDLRKGRLSVKFNRGGTTDPNVYTYFGISDPSNNWFTLFWRSNDATVQTASNTLGAGTATQVETTVGLGPTWVANTLLGWTYTESTKTYSLGKSTNGTTWTEIYKYVVTTPGAFNFKRAALVLGCTSYGTVTNFQPRWDDVSYYATDTELKARVRFGGALTSASVKVRVGGAWKRPIGMQRVGGIWVRGK